MCLVGKDWYGFGLMKSVNFGLCEFYLVIWLKPGKILVKPGMVHREMKH